ncbi:MAG: hypothetical protein ACRC9L_02050 [Brevinema sp.]
MTLTIQQMIRNLVADKLNINLGDVFLSKAENSRLRPLPSAFISSKEKSLSNAPKWEHPPSNKSFINIRRTHCVNEIFEVLICRQKREDALNDISMLLAALEPKIILDNTIIRMSITQTSIRDGHGDLDHATAYITILAEYGIYYKTVSHPLKNIKIDLVRPPR